MLRRLTGVQGVEDAGDHLVVYPDNNLDGPHGVLLGAWSVWHVSVQVRPLLEPRGRGTQGDSAPQGTTGEARHNARYSG